MTRAVCITTRAQRDLRRLDRQTADRVLTALARYARSDRGDVVRLHGAVRELRLRVGDWRVRFQFNADGAIEVLRVPPRGRAYRD